jgi:hypothetical protein
MNLTDNIKDFAQKIKLFSPLLFTPYTFLTIFVTVGFVVYLQIQDVGLLKAIFGSLFITIILYFAVIIFLVPIIGISYLFSKSKPRINQKKELLLNHDNTKAVLNSSLFLKIRNLYQILSLGIIVILCFILFFRSISLILNGSYNWVAFLFLLSPIFLFGIINEYRAKNDKINEFFLRYFSWSVQVKPMAGKFFVLLFKLSLASLIFWVIGIIIIMIPIQFYLLLILAVLIKGYKK